jgi:hypothetical protein
VGSSGPQLPGIKRILIAYTNMPPTDEGSTYVHLRAAVGLRDTITEVFCEGWLDRDLPFVMQGQLPAFGPDDLEAAGPTWMPNRRDLDAFADALRRVARFPFGTAQEVVGRDLLWMAQAAHVYATSIRMVDDMHGGVKWPAMRLWCRPCNQRQRFEGDNCTMCGRWYE